MIPFYECKFCFKKLTTEQRLEKHKCEPKKRNEMMKTLKGKSAFYCYKEWISTRGRATPKISTFIESKHFNTFIKFVEFCKRMGIPDRKFFISLMCEKKIAPMMWNSVDLYQYYIEEFDKRKSPMDLAKITVETLFDLARALECDVAQVFDNIEVSDLVKLVHYRKLTPWVLLFSRKFHEFLKHKSANQRLLINTVIDSKHWFKIFSENPEEVEKMKLYVRELQI